MNFSAQEIDDLFKEFASEEAELTTDLEKNSFVITSKSGKTKTLAFSISGFDRTLVEYGGWVGYADKNY